MFYVDSVKCTGCGACVQMCPVGAISLKGDKAVIDQELCTECGNCSEVCAAGAICEVRTSAVSPERTPETIVRRSTAISKKQRGLVAALVSVAPIAIDVLSGFARRWLSLREQQSNMPGTGLGKGAGRRRRWRGGRY